MRCSDPSLETELTIFHSSTSSPKQPYPVTGSLKVPLGKYRKKRCGTKKNKKSVPVVHHAGPNVSFIRANTSKKTKNNTQNFAESVHSNPKVVPKTSLNAPVAKNSGKNGTGSTKVSKKTGKGRPGLKDCAKKNLRLQARMLLENKFEMIPKSIEDLREYYQDKPLQKNPHPKMPSSSFVAYDFSEARSISTSARWQI